MSNDVTLYSPTGSEILGTLESTRGCSPTNFSRTSEGELLWEYAGETKMFWDDQMTERFPDGKDKWLDEDGCEWHWDQLTEDGPRFILERDRLKDTETGISYRFRYASASVAALRLNRLVHQAKEYKAQDNPAFRWEVTDQLVRDVVQDEDLRANLAKRSRLYLLREDGNG